MLGLERLHARDGQLIGLGTLVIVIKNNHDAMQYTVMCLILDAVASSSVRQLAWHQEEE